MTKSVFINLNYTKLLVIVLLLSVYGCSSQEKPDKNNNRISTNSPLEQSEKPFTIADSLSAKGLYDSSNIILSNLFLEFQKDSSFSQAVRALHSIAANYRMLANYDSAYNYLEKGTEIAAAYLDTNDINLSQIYFMEGVLKLDERNLEASKEYFDKSLKIRKEVRGPDHKLIGDIYNNYGIIHWYKAQYDSSIFYYNKGLRIRKINDPNGLSVSYSFNNLALCYEYMEQYDEALSYYDSSYAITLNLFGLNHPQNAIVLMNKSLVYYNLGDITASIENNQKSIEIMKEVYDTEFHRNLSYAYNNLGVLYLSVQDYQNAVEYFQNSLAIRKKINPEFYVDIATNYSNIGMAYLGMNKYEKALESLELAESLFEKADYLKSVEAENLYSWLIKTYLAIEKFSEAAEYANKKIMLTKSLHPPASNYLAVTYNQLAEVDLAKGDLNGVVLYAEKAIDIINRNEYNIFSNLEYSYFLMAQAYYSQKEYKKAIEYCNISIECYPADFSSNEESLINKVWSNYSTLKTYILKGDAYLNLYKEEVKIEHLQKAKEDFLFAADLIEKTRQGFLTESSQISYSVSSKDVFSKGVEAIYLSYTNNPNEQDFLLALNLAEKSKAATLYENLSETKAQEIAGIPDSLLYKEKSILSSIRFYSRLIEETENIEPLDSLKLIEYKGHLFKNRRKLEKLIKNFQNDYSDYASLKYSSPNLKLEDIRNKILDQDQTLVEYFLTDTTIYIFIISQDEFIFLSISKPEDLENVVENLIKSIKTNDSDSFTESSFQIYKTIFQPLTKFINTERCLIINDDVLGYIPYDSLIDQKIEAGTNYKYYPYLINKYSFGYAFSLNILLESEKDNKIVDVLGIAPQSVSN